MGLLAGGFALRSAITMVLMKES